MTLHRSNAGILVEQPVVRLVVLATSFGVRDFVLGVVSLHEVLHDASRLEQVDGLTIGEFIGQGRDAAIRVDGKEPVLLLCVLADIDLLNLVGNTTILSKMLSKMTLFTLTQAPLA